MSQDADALERAIALACRAHRGQRYPSPEAEPYILHPLRVMFAVQGFKAQTAAVLHDVLEDTEVNVDQLRQARIPDDVIAAVVALTHRMELTEMVDTPGLQPRRRPCDRAAAGQDGQATPGDPAPR